MNAAKRELIAHQDIVVNASLPHVSHSVLFQSISGHHALNDLVARTFAAARMSFTKEPAELSKTDGKRPASHIR